MENHGLLQTERERTGNRGTTGKHLPVAQWIVHAPPKREIQVRLLAGGHQEEQSHAEPVRAVVLQFLDRFVNVGQGLVAALFFE